MFLLLMTDQVDYHYYRGRLGLVRILLVCWCVSVSLDSNRHGGIPHGVVARTFNKGDSVAHTTTHENVATNSNKNQAFAIVQPIEGQTKLQVNQEGLELLQGIRGPVVPVVVIGPYRSGKSFTLNQLMRKPCDEGFGVGHTRLTQTKGIWVWGEPLVLKNDDGEQVNVVFVDTEGFESTGKSDVYDDRIFALSTLISEVLIYNLPESIRESDLEKLSFAAELAKAFYGNGKRNSVEPASMIWLIQRDFLEGDTLQETLERALHKVPNPHHDQGIDQLNHIREGLEMISKSSTAIGLPQPHLDRTRLCELDESDFDPGYVKQRDALRDLVKSMASPKSVKGEVLDGEGLVSLIVDTVTALNERDFPTSSSLVHFFNKDLVAKCKDMFVKDLAHHKLPSEEDEIRAISETIKKNVLDTFDRDRFGNDVLGLKEELEGLLGEALETRLAANELASSKACEHAELECEDIMEREAKQALPSTNRFKKRYEKCRAMFTLKCVGPGREHNAERLSHAWDRELSRFNKEFNDKLLNGVVFIAIAVVVIFRFVIRWGLGETAGWIVFIFLQIYPRTFIGSSSSMFDTKGWQLVVKIWEAIVDNPVIDIQRFGIPFMGIVLVVYSCRRCLTRVWRGRNRRRTKRDSDGKDLDV